MKNSSLIFQKKNILLALFFLFFTFLVYAPAILAPGLLDEQYLLAWLKEMPNLKASSSLAGFMNFSGFDYFDSWGVFGHLVLYGLGLIFSEKIFLYKVFSVLISFFSVLGIYSFSALWTRNKIFAFFAALLFLLYPLHFESVSWIGGLPFQLATLFYIASLNVYVFFRSKSWSWYGIALLAICTLISLSCTALAYPIVSSYIVLEMSYILDSKYGENIENVDKSSNNALNLIALLLPFVVLGVYFAASGISSLYEILPNFKFSSFGALFKHLFLPINEYIWQGYAREYILYYVVYVLVFLFAIFAFFLKKDLSELRRSVCLCFLLILFALTICGIYGNNSNLYGARITSLCSIPLCLLLASLLTSFGSIKNIWKIVLTSIASILLLLLSILFLKQLWNNNLFIRNQGRILHSVQESMKIVQEKLDLDFLLVKDLPKDLSFVPSMQFWGPAIFDPKTGLMRSSTVVGGKLKDIFSEEKFVDKAYRWENNLKSFLALELNPKKATWSESPNFESILTSMIPGIEFYKNIQLDKNKKCLVLDSNSKNGPMLTLDASRFSPIDGQFLYLDALIDAPSNFVNPHIELYWKTNLRENYDKAERFAYTKAKINDGKIHRYYLSLRSNGWISCGSPSVIALGFPAGASVQLYGIGLERQKESIAKLCLEPKQNILRHAEAEPNYFNSPTYNYPNCPELGLYALSEDVKEVVLNYDVSGIQDASGAVVEISQVNKCFDDANSSHLSSVTYKTFQYSNQKGSVSIDVSKFPKAGVYNLRLIACDKSGNFLGQFSDAIFLQVPKTVGVY